MIDPNTRLAHLDADRARLAAEADHLRERRRALFVAGAQADDADVKALGARAVQIAAELEDIAPALDAARADVRAQAQASTRLAHERQRAERYRSTAEALDYGAELIPQLAAVLDAFAALPRLAVPAPVRGLVAQRGQADNWAARIKSDAAKARLDQAAAEAELAGAVALIEA